MYSWLPPPDILIQQVWSGTQEAELVQKSLGDSNV